MQNRRPRKKTYKREFISGFLVFIVAHAVYSGDTEFLEITFGPTITVWGGIFGLHQVSENTNFLNKGNKDLEDRYSDVNEEGFEK